MRTGRSAELARIPAAAVWLWLEYENEEGTDCTCVPQSYVVDAAVAREMLFMKPEGASLPGRIFGDDEGGSLPWIECCDCNQWRLVHDAALFELKAQEDAHFSCADIGKSCNGRSLSFLESRYAAR